MKKTIIASTILSLTLFAGSAAAHHHKGEPGKRLQKLEQVLDLSDSQVAQVKEVFAEQREKRKAHKNAQRKVVDSKMKQILTAEQYEKLQKIKAKHKKKKHS